MSASPCLLHDILARSPAADQRHEMPPGGEAAVGLERRLQRAQRRGALGGLAPSLLVEVVPRRVGTQLYLLR